MSERIAFRVTKEERSEVEAAAKRWGMSVSELARTRTMETFQVPTPRRQKNDIEARTLTELNRVGVNLWQISRHLNYGGSIPNDLADAIEEVRAAVAKLAETAK